MYHDTLMPLNIMQLKRDNCSFHRNLIKDFDATFT